MGHRILIVKLAAIGDVLRTTPLLTGLKESTPEPYHLGGGQRSLSLLKNNPYIDRRLPFEFASLLPLEAEALIW